MIEKDLYECRNVSVKFLCVYLCLTSGDVYFSGKNFPVLFLCLHYPYFGTFRFYKFWIYLYSIPGWSIYLFPL